MSDKQSDKVQAPVAIVVIGGVILAIMLMFFGISGMGATNDSAIAGSTAPQYVDPLDSATRNLLNQISAAVDPKKSLEEFLKTGLPFLQANLGKLLTELRPKVPAGKESDFDNLVNKINNSMSVLGRSASSTDPNEIQKQKEQFNILYESINNIGRMFAAGAGGITDLAELAKRISEANAVSGNVRYCYGGKDRDYKGDMLAAAQSSGPLVETDCSGYMTYLLQQTGYFPKTMDAPATGEFDDIAKSGKYLTFVGSTYSKDSLDQAVKSGTIQSGDMINKAGNHIVMYIGEGKVSEAAPGFGEYEDLIRCKVSTSPSGKHITRQGVRISNVSDLPNSMFPATVLRPKK